MSICLTAVAPRRKQMSQRSEFHNLDHPVDGLLRELAAGVTTRIFSCEHAMLSVVTLAPHAEGTLHHHPEEQWGVLLDGSAVRVQGDEEIEVTKGDFWRTLAACRTPCAPARKAPACSTSSARRAPNTKSRERDSASPEATAGARRAA